MTWISKSITAVGFVLLAHAYMPPLALALTRS